MTNVQRPMAKKLNHNLSSNFKKETLLQQTAVFLIFILIKLSTLDHSASQH